MVWAAISSIDKSSIVFVDERINANRYIQVLQEALVTFVDKHSRRPVFQQDGETPGTAVLTKNWLSAFEIDVLSWHSRSPDANPIENSWSELSRSVYGGGRQFNHVEDLREAVVSAWDDLSANYIRSLIRYVPSRCFKIVEARGGPSGY